MSAAFSMQMNDRGPSTCSNTLKRKISWSDESNDSDEGNGNDNSNGCDELSRHSKVARTQPDIVWPEFTALNRKIPWSDNGDDEPARQSKAAQTRPKPSSALKQKSSDGDGGDDTDDSDLESLGGPKGAWAWPTPRKDIVWPRFPSRSPQCCLKCKAMTGTPEGLSALLSDGGYKHFNWYKIQETAALGCALCTMIWDDAEHKDWDYDDDGSVTRDEIRIFADATCLSSPTDGRLSRYPLKDIQLHSLEVRIPGMPRSPPYPEGELYHLVTFESKLTSWEKILRVVLIIV
jgi:hypothetical protein